jgi:hypothetical protein
VIAETEVFQDSASVIAGLILAQTEGIIGELVDQTGEFFLSPL